jgi:hypothetical protein
MGRTDSIVLKWVLKTWDVTIWIGIPGSRQGSLVSSCEHGNGPLKFIRSVEFLDYLSDY